MTLVNFNKQLELFAYNYCIDGYSMAIVCGSYHPIKTIHGIVIKHILRIFDLNSTNIFKRSNQPGLFQYQNIFGTYGGCFLPDTENWGLSFYFRYMGIEHDR